MILVSDEPSDQVRLLINSVGSKSRVPELLSMAKPPTKAPKSPTSGMSSSVAQEKIPALQDNLPVVALQV